jgi:dihydrofolate reductase
MKIIMVAAVSKDGFITNGDNPDVSEWTSDEDKSFFSDIKSKHSLFVMGSKTFDTGLVLPKPETLKIVLTKNPEKYSSQQVLGQLEFIKLSPQEFISNYESTHETCLLLGGGYTYTEFLEANLIDEIYLTIEPIIIEAGTPILNNDKSITDYCRQEHESTTLNSSGTLLQHYVLKK